MGAEIQKDVRDGVMDGSWCCRNSSEDKAFIMQYVWAMFKFPAPIAHQIGQLLVNSLLRSYIEFPV